MMICNKTVISGALCPLLLSAGQKAGNVIIGADSTAPIRFLLSHCLTGAAQEHRPQDTMRPEMFNYHLG